MAFIDPIGDAKRSNARLQFGMDTARLNWQRSRIQQQRRQGLSSAVRRFYQARQQLPGSFAARGMLNSGMYQQGIKDFNTERATSLRDLQQGFQYRLGENTIAGRQAGVTQQMSLADADAETAAKRREFDIQAAERLWNQALEDNRRKLLAEELRKMQ